MANKQNTIEDDVRRLYIDVQTYYYHLMQLMLPQANDMIELLCYQSTLRKMHIRATTPHYHKVVPEYLGFSVVVPYSLLHTAYWDSGYLSATVGMVW